MLQKPHATSKPFRSLTRALQLTYLCTHMHGQTIASCGQHTRRTTRCSLALPHGAVPNNHKTDCKSDQSCIAIKTPWCQRCVEDDSGYARRCTRATAPHHLKAHMYPAETMRVGCRLVDRPAADAASQPGPQVAPQPLLTPCLPAHRHTGIWHLTPTLHALSALLSGLSS